ncbi:hypothetical protein [uncultured Piscinibacter sp.]|uniref:hypothetical protein n=1 Tax=uncultured Piscinibacter sp. TaxID=1131835 RepID=UPI00261118E0|nr:hypothetical protein [uncultured Piscinibacter sp.]
MGDPLSPVLEALDALPAPLDAFVRDDDAGWHDARLLALLDAVDRAGTAIDLAAIPLALSDPLAAELRARIDAAPRRVAVHQHGATHANHQAEGRKCEFGAARTAAVQRSDIRAAWLLLQHLLGGRAQPLFTPPWNRCAVHTPAVLAELGFAALSRDRGAPQQDALPEIAVDVDWSRRMREGGPAAAAHAIAEALRARAGDGAPFGLMLHHAEMDGDEVALLAGWLARIARHGAVRWQPMADLLPTTARAVERTP